MRKPTPCSKWITVDSPASLFVGCTSAEACRMAFDREGLPAASWRRGCSCDCSSLCI
jgi:hypothetical protein